MKTTKDFSKLLVFSEQLLKKRELARKDFKAFIAYIKGDDYQFTDFHNNCIDDLKEFIQGSVNRMMLFAPPQHGKSELSSRLTPAFLLGLNPKLKLAIVCYSSTIAQGFSNDIQNIIASQQFGELFPDTKIDGVRGIKRGTLKRNNYEVHTNNGGYFISTGVGGPLTSKTVDIAIIDDLYKDKADAWSGAWRQRVWDWYFSVLERRLHNGSKILILYTRWHELDLAGEILKRESSSWKQIKYEIIKTGSVINERDKRQIGEALWEARHSKDSALRWKELDEVSFESLGQQNPKPIKGMLYPRHRTYSELPLLEDSYYLLKNYTDTADSGSDYLCSINYIEVDGMCYIIDMLYTQEPMDVTETLVANMIVADKIEHPLIESNNGGKGFARAVQKLIDVSNHFCNVSWFHQSDNKEAKIYSCAAKVMNRILWPHDWKERWPEAYESYTTYMREGKPEHDDLQDALSEIVSRIETETDIHSGICFKNNLA